MSKWKVTIVETIVKEYIIEASDEDEARAIWEKEAYKLTPFNEDLDDCPFHDVSECFHQVEGSD